MKRLLPLALLAALAAFAALRWQVGHDAAPAAAAPRSEGAAAYALQAYDRLLAEGFSVSGRRKARRLLNIARSMDPDEPRIKLALSQDALNFGYAKGSRYRPTSYHPVSLGVAERLATEAAEAAPDEPLAHVQRGKIQIIRMQHREAWATLDRAYRLDPASFHPWFLRGVISYHMGDAARARNYFDQAERFTGGDKLRVELLAGLRADAAEAFGDEGEADAQHRRLIAQHPPDRYAHYNYGLFLERRQRLSEALDQFGKARALGDFGLLRKATARVQSALATPSPAS